MIQSRTDNAEHKNTGQKVHDDMIGLPECQLNLFHFTYKIAE